MPPEESIRQEACAWLAKARNDLRAADLDLTAEPALKDDAAFHAQQAVEKALKAFLTLHGRIFRKTHNLVELGEQCCALDGTLEAPVRQAVPLTQFAWKYRYPGEEEEPSDEAVARAIQLARRVVDEVECRLREPASGA